MNVCLGGTFDPLHKGHRLLFDTALDLLKGDTLFVGVTSDDLARGTREGANIRDHSERCSDVEGYLGNKDATFKIVMIDKPTGIAHEDPVLDAIVVSPETFPQAQVINLEREKRGLGKLAIFIVDLVSDPKGRIIRGTHIRAGEMDEEGKAVNDRELG